MRLNCFDLTRYGKFTDLSLPFGATVDGGPDLHVIYGANEAGKSTFLSGWLDLLFQISVRSPMGFLHPYTSMQLGAALEIDGRPQNVIRVKKRDHSLLDAQGGPIGEALLTSGLRGLDRKSYAAMFSLNRNTLDEGGESILASEGDLGELLFQASAGLTDLATQIDTLRDESMEFLNATGRKGRLRDLRAEFDRLGEQMKSLDTAASDYARLAKDRDAARTTWQNARNEAEAAQTALNETERLGGAIPLVSRLERIEVKIAEIGDLPVPPEGWLAELPGLDREETVLATKLETTKKSVADLEDELGKIPQDTEILEVHDRIGAVGNLKSAYDTAQEDLPKRLKERDGESQAIRDCLARLGQPDADPATVLPEVAVLGRLRGLVEQHSGIAASYAAATEELDRTRTEADRTALRLKNAGGSTADLGGLGGLVQSIRRDDPVGSLARAQALLAEAEADWQERLAALAPWVGDETAVANFALPDRAGVERLAADVEDANRKVERERETLQRLEQDAAQREARLQQTSATSVVTLEDAAKVRAQREAEWVHHRANLNSDTADRFEGAMRLDDQVAASVADQQTQAKFVLEAEQALAGAWQLVDAAKTRVKEAAALHDGLVATFAGIVSGVSPLLSADMTSGSFLTWLKRADDACGALRKCNEARRRVSYCEDVLDRARSGLVSAMSQAGRTTDENTDLALIVETAQSLLDRAAQLQALSEADATAQQELGRRETALADAAKLKTKWQSEWTAACADTWMVEAPATVAEMRAILDELDQLRRHFDRVSDLNRRIASMKSNSGQFGDAVNALKDRLGMTTDIPPHEAWGHITQRLHSAETSQGRCADLQKRLASARQTHSEIEQEAKLHRTRTAAFTDFFSVATWQQAREALSRAGEREKLRQTRDECAEDLCGRLQASTIQEALKRLEGISEAELEAHAESLRTDLKTLRSNQEEAHTSFRKAEDDLDRVGGDAAVARLEEQRQTLLLEMEDGARHHLQKRLGLLAVDAALRQYRDTHRSGMLDRASEAFRTMSGGRYSGLAAQPDGAREILVALAAEGGSKQADQLSDGTRAQLYLALRIAGYHEFVRNNGPVPFVADDIMESFDDDRAAEAFGLLAKMSEVGQVIYLTHHAHVCDIARSACPAVNIHELPA
ncbi:chromosome segregation protein [Thalassovita gelatinovora]|uniref:Chromosome segregation protein n=1 Tax=Thalassovita gelatinovora TaxID=53501 RepID=A0A0P1F950_THAGE|nr:AAA family ATPase [Thalassovita gelatinovora]QIZ81310.1 AAA family ATPase [Thalassovita gelatinovora]CUH64529.1 chromosome segregation protein [Thalassovita gelatinovora]SEP96856.1 AAA domain-containing protein [Thalassovita gelatinovora]